MLDKSVRLESYLYDESSKVAENVVDIFVCPNARSRHGLDQICASQQGNLCSLGTVWCLNTTSNYIDLVIEMVENLCGFKVFFVEGLPRIN